MDYRSCYDPKYLSDHVDMTDMTVSSDLSLSFNIHFNEKCRAVSVTNYLSNYSRLELPSAAPEKTLPIQPGIFKGTTRYDGIQLLFLSYKNNGKKVTGQKITVYI